MAGSLYALLHHRLPLKIRAVRHGVIFGNLVWAGSYKGWVLGLGIMPPPERDQPIWPKAMLVAFGGIAGAVVGRREENTMSAGVVNRPNNCEGHPDSRAACRTPANTPYVPTRPLG